MKTVIWVLTFFISLFLFVDCGKEQAHSKMCGAWKMINGMYEGPGVKVINTEDERICYKLVSESHFAVIEMYRANPESLFFAAVGTYTWDDTSYTEYYEASNETAKVGQILTFKSNVDEYIWKISLKQQDMTLDETWERTAKLPKDVALK